MYNSEEYQQVLNEEIADLTLEQKAKKAKAIKERIDFLTSQRVLPSGINTKINAIKIKNESIKLDRVAYSPNVSNFEESSYFNATSPIAFDNKIQRIRFILNQAIQNKIRITRDELNEQENGAYLFMLTYKQDKKVQKLLEMWELIGTFRKKVNLSKIQIERINNIKKIVQNAIKKGIPQHLEELPEEAKKAYLFMLAYKDVVKS